MQARERDLAAVQWLLHTGSGETSGEGGLHRPGWKIS